MKKRIKGNKDVSPSLGAALPLKALAPSGRDSWEAVQSFPQISGAGGGNCSSRPAKEGPGKLPGPPLGLGWEHERLYMRGTNEHETTAQPLIETEDNMIKKTNKK